MNRVRGPTSALTSFLRERGITPRNLSRRNQENREEQNQAEPVTRDNGESSPEPENGGVETESSDETVASNNNITEETSSSSGRRTSARLRRINIADDSTHAEPSSSSSNSRRRRAGTTSNSLDESTSTKQKKNQKRKKKDDDQDSDDEYVGNNSAYRQSRKTGSRVEICSKCRRHFILKQALAQNNEKKILCPTCAAGGTVTTKRPPRKKKTSGAMDAEEDRTVPSLQNICIRVIAANIDRIEAFGDIGTKNLDKICKIICRLRQLDEQTVLLFLDPLLTELKLYDCTNLDSERLINLAQFCPLLEKLNLQMCGRMTSEVLTKYGTHLSNLREISLSGCYLIRPDGFINLFSSVASRLEVFAVKHAQRLDVACLNSLVEHCPNLRELRLSQCDQIDDECLQLLLPLQKLEVLEISDPRKTVTAAPLVEILNNVGHQLKELNLARCVEVGDDLVSKGLTQCTRLEKLVLAELAIKPESMVELFTQWASTNGLLHLDIGRCYDLNDSVISAFTNSPAAPHLRYLSINSLDLSADALAEITAKCHRLQSLDASFVQSVDDYFINALVEGCRDLTQCWVFGCNHVTECANVPPTLILKGRESDTL
ncbi:uncharacterized protein VTP21DRAFT_4497 [Calcarisporiella thermophila]|uniref:uncharacterized protein n=1 Tax=Calcarisporiella thermophila TaxID=911321 RepID=UPI003742EED8